MHLVTTGILTLPLVICLGEAALGDAPALVVEALSARHGRRGGRGAGGGGGASCASSRGTAWWSSGVSQAIGVVARSSVHGKL